LQNTTVSSAGSETWREIDYRIESQDIANSGWDYTNTSSYITISFWLRASVTQSYILYIRSQDGTPRLLIKELAVTANTWKKFELAIPGDSGITMDNDSNLGLLLRFIPWYGDNYTGSGTLDAWTSNTTDKVPDMTSTWVTTLNSTFDLTGLQLEVGSKATPFEHESYGQTLAKCQRYYYKHIEGTGQDIAAGAYYTATLFALSIKFPVTMRTAPGLDYETGAGFYRIYRTGATDGFDAMSGTRSTPNSIAIDTGTGTSGTAGQAGIASSVHDSAYIGFTAEL
jgi:hypothetical protein